MNNFNYTANSKYKLPFELTEKQKTKYKKMLIKSNYDKETRNIMIVLFVLILIKTFFVFIYC